MEVQYARLHEKYKKLKKMKESEMEKFNREQDSNFIEYVKAAEDMIEYLRNENNQLLTQMNEMKNRTDLYRSDLENQVASYHKLWSEENEKTKMLSEELERFRNLAPEENLSGSPTVGSVGLPSSSVRRRLSILDDRSHQAQNEEVGTIQNRSCQEEHATNSQRSAKAGMVFSEDISKKLDFCERGMDCSGSGLNEVGHGSDAFRALLECLISMKVSINSRAEGLGVSILHQSSVMEESEKRMERLRAMRLEAEQAGHIDSRGASTASGSLANPLIESSPTQPFVESSVPVRPMNPYMNPAPRPTHQFRGNYFPDQRPNMQQIPWTSPVGSTSPYDQRPSGTPVPWGSPVAHHGISPSNPAAWNRYRGSSGNRPSFNPTRGGFSGPRMVRGGGSSNYLGRGRGGRHSFNPNPGRGRGSHATVSAMEHPELFYKKNMVEDPWKFLKPIVRHVGSGKNASWLPKSVSTKKARVSEGSSSFQVHGSLAEFLACSFEEAANEAEGS
ncbi:hypothetical protein QJS04_geneDACA006513 [Acorus gramineus]|uniref:Uncharacterized protein n=1 Tax=Acorus gramineus TaxID=55184 RepID=A0AAV9AWS6_ACOGR|nr:hypothetical protein QJS04_geneDACA006513 [Acorus gramineus]